MLKSSPDSFNISDGLNLSGIKTTIYVEHI